MTRRLLVSYLSLTVVILAILEVPLGFVNARNERANLTAKVERDAVSVASLAEGTLEGERTATNVAALGGWPEVRGRHGRAGGDHRPQGRRDRRLRTTRTRAAKLRDEARVRRR